MAVTAEVDTEATEGTVVEAMAVEIQASLSTLQSAELAVEEGLTRTATASPDVSHPSESSCCRFG